MRIPSLLSLILLFASPPEPAAALELTTTAKSKLSANNLQDFISRPINWPKIVASSTSVSSEDPSVPLKRGDSVDEYFGLNLLSVKWTCEETQPGFLVVRAPEGVPGIADNCSMNFEFKENQVKLTMGYNPLSPLAILATPVLIVDNWLALNVLLPAAVDTTPLDSFRKLMGSLYGIAGLAHLADILVGPSTLLVEAGTVEFSHLPPAGQAYALLWCAVGPLSYGLSLKSLSKPYLADLGLVVYGIVEVLGTVLIGNSTAIMNASLVQAVVLRAWAYSWNKQANESIMD